MEHVNGWCVRGIYKGGLWEDDLHVSALPAIASDMDTVLLKVSVVEPKPFDTGTTHSIYLVRDTSYHFLGHLVHIPSFEMHFNVSVFFYQTRIDIFYHDRCFSQSIHHLTYAIVTPNITT